MVKINVVAIDLRKNQYSGKYNKLSVEDKIKKLVQVVEDSYQAIKQRDPDSLVVMAWREYGVFDSKGISDRTIDYTQKNEFKKVIAKLTENRDDLVIIGGTIASKKDSKDIKNKDQKLESLKKIYEKYSFISGLEFGRSQFDYYHQKEKVNKKVNEKEKKEFTAIKNSCFIFANGKVISKRGKVAPYEEYPDSSEDFIYRFNNDFEITTLEFRGEKIPIVVEICRENVLGILKTLVDKDTIKKPLMHFIISDSAEFDPNNMCGDFVLQIDSQEDLKFLIDNDKYPDDFVKTYRVNPYEDKIDLERVWSATGFAAFKLYLENLETKLGELKKQLPPTSDSYRICQEIEEMIKPSSKKMTGKKFKQTVEFELYNRKLSKGFFELEEKQDTFTTPAEKEFLTMLQKFTDYEGVLREVEKSDNAPNTSISKLTP